MSGEIPRLRSQGRNGPNAQAARGALAGSSARSRQHGCSLGLPQLGLRLDPLGQGGTWLSRNATARQSGTKQDTLLRGQGHPTLREGEART